MRPLTLQEGGHVNYSQLPPLPFKRDADGNATAERDRGAFAALNGDHTHFLLIDDNGRSKVGWGAEVDLKAAVDAAWSKWPSWRGHSWPPRARQTASVGLGLAF